MGKSASELRIGDVDVYIDKSDGNGEQSLGYTKGGVEFSFEREFVDLIVDEFGSAPLDKCLTGNKVKIKMTLAQPSTANMSKAIPEGDYDYASSDSKLGLGRSAGQLMSAYAGILRLHPRKNVPTNHNEDVYIWKAVSVENVVRNYKIDEQAVVDVTFEGLVDTTREDGLLLGRIGDEAIS